MGRDHQRPSRETVVISKSGPAVHPFSTSREIVVISKGGPADHTITPSHQMVRAIEQSHVTAIDSLVDQRTSKKMCTTAHTHRDNRHANNSQSVLSMRRCCAASTLRSARLCTKAVACFVIIPVQRHHELCRGQASQVQVRVLVETWVPIPLLDTCAVHHLGSLVGFAVQIVIPNRGSTRRT